jgi:large subunit ribosomal protein L1
MAKITKRKKIYLEKVIPGKAYSFDEGSELLKALPGAKFKKNKESVDIAIRLGVDPKKSDQVVRGSTVMPNGTGKTVKVAVFTQGLNVEKAKEAGADYVGLEDLAEELKKGSIDFDVVIATPDAMGVVGRLGPVLGPRGLMPNPKVGTVSADVAKAVSDVKGGQVRFRTDKNGIVHASIGKVDFTTAALRENLEKLLADVRRLKPVSSKGTFFKKLSLSTTMGPGLAIDLTSLNF